MTQTCLGLRRTFYLASQADKPKGFASGIPPGDPFHNPELWEREKENLNRGVGGSIRRGVARVGETGLRIFRQ